MVEVAYVLEITPSCRESSPGSPVITRGKYYKNGMYFEVQY